MKKKQIILILVIFCFVGSCKSLKKESINLEKLCPPITIDFNKINYARVKEIEKITDQEILINIAKNDKDDFIRTEAVDRITDQKVLKFIAKYDKIWTIRAIAVCILTDKKTLKFIVKNDVCAGVCLAASERLKELNKMN